jgi:hypothetical protein
MAELLDGNHEPQLADDEEYQSLDTLHTEPVEGDPVEQEDEVPEKYKGKSAAELVRMHQEAEKLSGRQGNEVGELRKLVDDFIMNQSATKQPEENVEISDLDFLENPNATLDKKLENHPALKAAGEATKKLAQLEAKEAIFNAHPDAMEIVNDENFRTWVEKSKSRTSKLQKANDGFDFDAADDLFTTWKEQQELIGQAKANTEQERKRSLKSGSNGSARGSGESTTKKFLKRSEILHMMQHEPERYLANSDVITQAYAEGRVR